MGPYARILKFLGDRKTTFIDLQTKLAWRFVARVCFKNNGNVTAKLMLQRQHKRGHPIFGLTIHFHLYFSECTMSLEWRKKISTTNCQFLPIRVFIEDRNFSHGNDAKKNMALLCQGYYYEDNPSGIDGANGRAEDVAERKRIVAASTEFRLFGKIACDFLSCDKHLISGVTIRLSLRRSPNDFVIMSEHRDKHYRVEITEANLYVRKMTVTDFVLSSIEKTLLKTPAIYNYIEVLPRTFLATTGVQSWRQEDVFAKEPVRRMILAMSSNTAYLGTNRTNPFHYQKFQLNEIIVYRNGLPIAGTPVSTTDNKRIYYNTLEALDFVFNNSHGISLANYHNHYIMAFDLTSTQEASHDFIHPELTNCTISVELKFDAPLVENVELLFMGERASTVYVRSDRKIAKNTLMS